MSEEQPSKARSKLSTRETLKPDRSISLKEEQPKNKPTNPVIFGAEKPERFTDSKDEHMLNRKPASVRSDPSIPEKSKPLRDWQFQHISCMFSGLTFDSGDPRPTISSRLLHPKNVCVSDVTSEVSKFDKSAVTRLSQWANR